MMKTIALFRHHPECSNQCCDGMIRSLVPHYVIKIFSEHDMTPKLFDGVDIVAFPGGIGDADRYHDFFKRRAGNMVADFVDRGGYYLGICMGAYWAGSHYFDILKDVEPVQYIKRPNADIRRSYSTVAPVSWLGSNHSIFFYDGCALIGDDTKFDTIAKYSNGDPMAIIQDRIGLIGCHPESEKFWYDKPYLKDRWHDGKHHNLLLNFVNKLTERGQDGNAAVC